MKLIFTAATFAAALGVVQSLSPAQAQTADEIKRICLNEHSLGQYYAVTSDHNARPSQPDMRPSVRSKGKS